MYLLECSACPRTLCRCYESAGGPKDGRSQERRLLQPHRSQSCSISHKIYRTFGHGLRLLQVDNLHRVIQMTVYSKRKRNLYCARDIERIMRGIGLIAEVKVKPYQLGWATLAMPCERQHRAYTEPWRLS